MERILRRPALLEITGLSAATIYRWIEQGTFPRPVQLGPNSVGWRASEVEAWIESREPIGGNGASLLSSACPVKPASEAQ